jgi:phage terminase large subunit
MKVSGMQDQRRKWLEDPASYCRERLGIYVWDKLEEILISVRDNRKTVVRSANGVGKTYIAAAIVCWWLDCHMEAIAFVTGSNWNAVEKGVFPNIRQFALEREVFPPQCIFNTEVKLSPRRFAFGRSTDEPTGIAGIHSPHLLQVVEESSGLKQVIADAIEGNAKGDSSRELDLGNPLSADGPYYEWCTNPNISVIHISAFDHPNVKEGREIVPGAVTRANIEDAAKNWCKQTTPNTPGAVHLYWLGDDGWYIPDNRFRGRIMGEFPATSEEQLISRDLLERAARNPHVMKGLAVAGCDVARFGDDKTVVAMAYPGGIDTFYSWQGKRTTESAGKLTQMSSQFQMVMVDDTSVGGGVADTLFENGIKHEGIHWGMASRSPETVTGDEGSAPRFANLITEMAWKLKKAIEDDPNFFIPNDAEFIKEASERRYRTNGKGQLILESKDVFKKRIRRSPDKFDAAIMAYYGVTFTPVVAVSASAEVYKSFQEPTQYEQEFNRGKYD